MRRPISDHQLRWLIVLASPTLHLVGEGDGSAKRLTRRGLLRYGDGATTITRDGLARLVEEWPRVPVVLDKMKTGKLRRAPS